MIARVSWSSKNSEFANQLVVHMRVTTIANLTTEGPVKTDRPRLTLAWQLPTPLMFLGRRSVAD